LILELRIARSNRFNKFISFFSKRSQSADHSLNDKLSRNKALLARQIRLLQILKQVDTSGRQPAMVDQPDVSTTTTTALNNLVGPGNDSSSKKRKNGKGKKSGKRRQNKKGRKIRRRRTRAVADDIVNLLESEHGDDILRAIVEALDNDYEYTNDVQDLEKFVRSSSRKCKCSLSRKHNG